jgi:hypothetical protein
MKLDWEIFEQRRRCTPFRLVQERCSIFVGRNVALSGHAVPLEISLLDGTVAEATSRDPAISALHRWFPVAERSLMGLAEIIPRGTAVLGSATFGQNLLGTNQKSTSVDLRPAV